MIHTCCVTESASGADYRLNCLSKLRKSRRIELLDRKFSKKIFFISDNNKEFFSVVDWLVKNQICLKEDHDLGVARYALTSISCYAKRDFPEYSRSKCPDDLFFSIELTPEKMGCSELEFDRKFNELRSIFTRSGCKTRDLLRPEVPPKK
jgi:hypothetical protein